MDGGFTRMGRGRLNRFLAIVAGFEGIYTRGRQLFSCHSGSTVPSVTLRSGLNVPGRHDLCRYNGGSLFTIIVTFQCLLPGRRFLGFGHALAMRVSDFLGSAARVSRRRLLHTVKFPTG